jgi:AraC-like DNA-binding protein
MDFSFPERSICKEITPCRKSKALKYKVLVKERKSDGIIKLNSMERTKSIGSQDSKQTFVNLKNTYGKKQDSGFHKHKLDQILFVSKGVFLFEDHYCKQALYGDLAAFIPRGVSHRAISIGENVDFHAIYFDEDNRIDVETRVKFFFASNLLKELVIYLNQEKKNNKSEKQKSIIALLRILIKEELSKRDRSGIELPRSSDSRVLKIIDYFDDNYDKNFQLENLKGILPLSTKQISRIFLDNCKITIIDYLKLKRIQTATILLNTTDKSIIEISADCGYESLSSFYAHFEELVGSSPKKFRVDSAFNQKVL